MVHPPVVDTYVDCNLTVPNLYINLDDSSFVAFQLKRQELPFAIHQYLEEVIHIQAGRPSSRRQRDPNSRVMNQVIPKSFGEGVVIVHVDIGDDLLLVESSGPVGDLAHREPYQLWLNNRKQVSGDYSHRSSVKWGLFPMLRPLLKGIAGRAIVVIVPLLVGHMVACVVRLWEVVVFPVMCQELWFHDTKTANAKADWLHRRYTEPHQDAPAPRPPLRTRQMPTPLPNDLPAPPPARTESPQEIANGVLGEIMKGFAQIVNLKQDSRPRYAPAKEPKTFDGTRKSDVRRFVSQCENYFILQGGRFGSEREKIFWASSYLTGAAHTWWR
jgi:hypothetical protein